MEPQQTYITDIYAETLMNIKAALTVRVNNTADLSLNYGYAGGTLFLYYYGKTQDDVVATGTAQQLLINLYTAIIKSSIKKINDQLPGIGWLFAFLTNQQVIEIDPDDILKNIDTVILKYINYQFGRSLLNGGTLSKGSYLVERYKGASEKLKKIQITESLVALVDEIRFNLEAMINKKTQSGTGLFGQRGEHQLQKIRNLSRIIYLLNKIYSLNIYNNAVRKLLLRCDQGLKSLIDSYTSDMGAPEIKEFATLLLATHALKMNDDTCNHGYANVCIDGILTRYKDRLFDLKNTAAIGDLVLAAELVLLVEKGRFDDTFLSALREKLLSVLCNSVNQARPGYINSVVGIPNLGIKEGLSAAGMALINRYEIMPANSWLDALLLY